MKTSKWIYGNVADRWDVLGMKGNRFNYLCNGEYRQRVILGVQTTLNILGAVDGVPKVTATTSLTLGAVGATPYYV
ncbi:hypothetical protein [Nostoc sp.]